MTDASGTARFRLTEDDMVAAARLFGREGLRRPRTLRLFAMLALMAFALFTALLMGVESFDGAVFLGHLPLIVLLTALPFAVVWALIAILTPRAARTTYRQQRSLQVELTYAWSDRGLAISSEYGAFEIPWSHFMRWAEDERTFLLYESDRLYRLVPRRVLAPDQQSSLRQALRQIGA